MTEVSRAPLQGAIPPAHVHQATSHGLRASCASLYTLAAALHPLSSGFCSHVTHAEATVQRLDDLPGVAKPVQPGAGLGTQVWPPLAAYVGPGPTSPLYSLWAVLIRLN